MKNGDRKYDLNNPDFLKPSRHRISGDMDAGTKVLTPKESKVRRIAVCLIFGIGVLAVIGAVFLSRYMDRIPDIQASMHRFGSLLFVVSLFLFMTQIAVAWKGRKFENPYVKFAAKLTGYTLIVFIIGLPTLFWIFCYLISVEIYSKHMFLVTSLFLVTLTGLTIMAWKGRKSRKPFLKKAAKRSKHVIIALLVGITALFLIPYYISYIALGYVFLIPTGFWGVVLIVVTIKTLQKKEVSDNGAHTALISLAGFISSHYFLIIWGKLFLIMFQSAYD